MRQSILTDFYQTIPSKNITWPVYIGNIVSSMTHYILPRSKTSNHANLIQTKIVDYYQPC